MLPFRLQIAVCHVLSVPAKIDVMHELDILPRGLLAGLGESSQLFFCAAEDTRYKAGCGMGSLLLVRPVLSLWYIALILCIMLKGGQSVLAITSHVPTYGDRRATDP